MTETVHTDYECSSEGAVRHWEIPYARLTHNTPTPTNAAEVLSLLPGTQLVGTILSIDAVNSVAIIDFTNSMVYTHDVRNVLTYNPGVAELTWGPINIGDPIYYDHSAGLPAGVFLSTSPIGTDAVANTLFGFAAPCGDTDMARFPLGAALVASTQRLSVMQLGAGH